MNCTVNSPFQKRCSTRLSLKGLGSQGRMGRETARHLGLRYEGLIGVLIEAKRKGLVNAVKPHLDALRGVAGLRVSDALYTRVLQDEGEI